MSDRRILPGRVGGIARAPPSKSYTHRALVAGFLARRPYRIRHPLDAEDTRATRQGLERLGACIDKGTEVWTVRPRAPDAAPFTIDCRESGTTLRFLAAVGALGDRPVRFVGRGRLSQRPMEELYAALESLGARVDRAPSSRSLPVSIRGPLRPGSVRIPGSVSSQFVSALLLALPVLAGDSEIRIVGPWVSRPYIDATLALLRYHGIRCTVSPRGFRIPGPQTYARRGFDVPADASSAAYLWAAAARTGGRVRVPSVSFTWPQSDLRILEYLRRMGATVRRRNGGVEVSGPLSRPIEADLTDSPDLFPLLGALAAGIPGESRLQGAAQVAFKESDRRAETVRIVRALGARALPSPPGLRIRGTPAVRALEVRDLTDHRLMMSAAVAALGAPTPSTLGDARCVAKSYPGFWTALSRLRRHGGDVN
jgi:3-phosphoshikimate 1-carboxyvinyltransferase